MLLLLCGCDSTNSMDRAMLARSKFQSTPCRFRATVSADYGDMIHTFVLECEADERGDVAFSVAAPDTISGITGSLTGESGFLTFDGEILGFNMLADGQLSPVSAPWVLIHTLRGGYLRYCAETDSGLHLTIDDSYAENALTVDIWLEDGEVEQAEIAWEGRRCLTMTFDDFSA